MKKTTLLIVLLFVATPALAFTTTGFQNPYGVVVDVKSGFIYISNVNGAMDAKDANGFISRLKGDGTVDTLRFIDGANSKTELHAPKGMAVIGNSLYVADIEKLKVFDVVKGGFLYNINFGNLPVQHFYDVKMGPDGALYLADSPANTIYRIDPAKKHEVTVFISGAELGQPHGIAWNSNTGVFGVTGGGKGTVIAFDRAGKRQARPTVFLQDAWGVDADNMGSFYASSGALGGVYRIDRNFSMGSFQNGLAGPAGVAFNNADNEVIVALFNSNTVISWPAVTSGTQ